MLEPSRIELLTIHSASVHIRHNRVGCACSLLRGLTTTSKIICQP